MMAAATPLLSSETVTTGLLVDKSLPPSSRGRASRFASRMFCYEQSWNASPPPVVCPLLAAGALSTDPRALLRAAGIDNGIFPCFLGGLLSALFWSISRAPMILRRVSRGSTPAAAGLLPPGPQHECSGWRALCKLSPRASPPRCRSRRSPVVNLSFCWQCVWWPVPARGLATSPGNAIMISVRHG